jgi:hypothetical protein
VVVADELVPLAGGLAAGGDADGDRAESIDGGGGRGQRQGELAGRPVAGVAAVAVAVTRRRQGDQPVGVHAVECDPGGHVFSLPAGAVPGEGVADGVGDGAAGGQGRCQAGDDRYLGGGEIPAAAAVRALAAGRAGHGGWSFLSPGVEMFQGSRASSAWLAGRLAAAVRAGLQVSLQAGVGAPPGDPGGARDGPGHARAWPGPSRAPPAHFAPGPL